MPVKITLPAKPRREPVTWTLRNDTYGCDSGCEVTVLEGDNGDEHTTFAGPPYDCDDVAAWAREHFYVIDDKDEIITDGYCQ